MVWRIDRLSHSALDKPGTVKLLRGRGGRLILGMLAAAADARAKFAARHNPRSLTRPPTKDRG